MTAPAAPALPAEPHPGQFAHQGARWLAATRPAFLTVSLAGSLLGLAASLPAVSWALVGWALLAVLLLQAGVNVFNDYYDHLSGNDAANTERLFPFTGGSRFIQNGVMSAGQMLALALALFAGVTVIGVGLVWLRGPALLALGLAGVVLGWAYSAPPCKLNSRGLGELTVALTFYGVPLGMALVAGGQVSPALAWASVSQALLITALLYVNQFPDRRADALAGKRHWVVRLPLAGAVAGHALLLAAAYGWLVLGLGLGRLPMAAALGLLTLPLSLRAALQLGRHADTPSRLRPAIIATLLAANLHPVCLAVGLAHAAYFTGN